MALSALVEAWATKKAQIDKKNLEINELNVLKAGEIAPLQAQISAVNDDYNNQIAVKRAEIVALESEIKELAT